MTYAELQQAIANYVHRSDLSAVIPTFIEAARSRINRDLRVREMIQAATETPIENPRALPEDFLELRDISYITQGQRKSLVGASRERMSLYDTANLPQTFPVFYSIDGTSIETQPGGIGTEFQWLYYTLIPEFVNDTDTHITLMVYPTIWLYASLIEAHSYNQDDELRLVATDIYTSEVQQANDMSSRGEQNALQDFQGASSWL